MKIKYILFFVLVAAISSCSTAYRSGQTPDDVYYSPAPEQNTYVTSKSDRDRNSYSYRNSEESEIRRGIQNPVYRNSLSIGLGMGYSPYAYSPFGYSPYGGFGNSLYGYDPYMSHGMYSPSFYNPYGYNSLSFYNPYSFYSPYNFYGSPYYGHGGYLGPISYGNANTNTGPRRYNLSPYNNSINNSRIGIRSEVRSNISSPNTSAPVRTFTTQPRTTGAGNVIRRVFTPSESRSNNNSRSENNSRNTNRNYNNNTQRNERPTYEAPTRSFESSTPSSNNSSSGSGGNSGGSAPTRSFRR